MTYFLLAVLNGETVSQQAWFSNELGWGKETFLGV